MPPSRSRQLNGPIRVMRIIARLNIGGPAIHVALLTAGMRDNTFTTTLVTGQVGAAEGDMTYLADELGIAPVVIPGLGREISLLDDLRAFFALLKQMLQERPHIVHTHTAKAGFLGRLAARLSGVPVVVHTFHGHVFRGYFGPLRTAAFLWLERLSALMTDRILTISDGLRDDLVALRIAAPERITVIPLGLDLRPLAESKKLRGRFRRELGWNNRTLLVGIIGRLVPIKNHDLFLKAAQEVRKALPQTCFVIVGDGERRSELEQMAAGLGLADAVRFVGWRRDLPAIYSDLDAVVIASRNEGTPVSLIEAMAAGAPVVSTAVGGVPDLLEDGKLGVLVPPDNVTELAEGVIRVLREGRGDRTLQAQAHALQQYDSARLVADMRALYQTLLQRKGFVIPPDTQGR